MRIGINLLPLWPGKIGGMETYVRNLLDALNKIDKTNIYYLFTAPWNDKSINLVSPNFKKVLIEEESPQFIPKNVKVTEKAILRVKYVRYLYKIWKKYKTHRMAKIIEQLALDVWFCPLISLDPRYLKIPSVITIPDIQQEYFPQFFSEQELLNRENNWKQSCYQASKVITISDFSKKCLNQRYQLPPDKVEVALLAASRDLGSAIGTKDAEIAKKLSLPKEYAFYPANTWPHKNHQLLIMGLALFKKEMKSRLKLVLSGVDDSRQELESLINQLGLKGEVIFLGHIKKTELPVIYRKASFMIFPSLFEGFGIPILEAMACGCPVAASNSTSIPEVAGKAVFYFDARNPKDIARAFKNMTSDLALRDNLIKAGRNQLKNFSWEKTATQTLKVFDALTTTG